MEIPNQNSDIRLAKRNDKPLIISILSESFKNDPHMAWLLEKSKSKNKLQIMLDYIVEETFSKGRIYLTNNNQGAALWQSDNKEKINFSFVKRNISFLFKLGVKTVIRSLSFVKVSHSHFPLNQNYCYLLAIGVLPAGQGNGLASKLMNFVLEFNKCNKIPVFLETANPTNVEIYKKKGFKVMNTFEPENIKIYFMKL